MKGKKPNMVVLSPGPGNPSDFGLSTTIEFLTKHKIPAFGVCLGLQGMVEHFGGTLGILGYPMHGKPSGIILTKEGKTETSIFTGLPENFEVARYHSLHGIKETLPSSLEITAISEDGIVMGIQHKTLPFAAVQFHPESILTSPAHGLAILKNALSFLRYEDDDSDDEIPGSVAEVVADLEELGVSELKERLKDAGISSGGTKNELVVKLALWTQKSEEANNGQIDFENMSVFELRELKQGLGLKGTTKTKDELITALKECLM
mmetsp:Transcript_31204/g.45685  ORF Transcript_31204/g.45685 Transcript_31204/m.45685 type:complete len:263 (+) Transcript_31204:2339-3127(+)